MNTQLYTAASGLRVEQHRMDTIANNLANLSSDGFRPRRTFVQAFDGAMQARPDGGTQINHPVATAGTFELDQPGSVHLTGRQLDVALDNGQVLAVQTAEGVRFTRAGNLSVNAEGVLTDAIGHPVLGPDDAPIENVPPSAGIRADGAVIADGAQIGTLQVWRDELGALEPIGQNLLEEPDGPRTLEAVEKPDLRPGWLESSAANPLDELVRLIQSQRAFQTYQKLVTTTMNDVNRKTVNDIAG